VTGASGRRAALGRWGKTSAKPTARCVCLSALLRIDDGAYANLVLPPLLAGSGLPTRDRRLVTELVYGTTRMRRACDWLIDSHLVRPVEPVVRAALRLGAYQLAFTRTPPHAAVSATVSEVPPRARGLVNAVLRRVAACLPPTWPDAATAWSFPDWIVERLRADLGRVDADAALVRMNAAPATAERTDGYVQDLASQWVAAYVGAGPGQRVADLCAAPGGKATALALGSNASEPPVLVVGVDVHESRGRLLAANARRLHRPNLATITADARRAPLRPVSFDRVLLDAPCSGLGVLGRRPDARWRIRPDDVADLVGLQRELLGSAVALLRPDGVLVYSVCTLTLAETAEIDGWLRAEHPGLEAVEPPGPPWQRLGRGAHLLPQTAGTDGMFVLGLRKAGR
jgi:16S rRNA (cytosine967-C5)-methyltransferase